MKLIHGDCLEVMPVLPANSIDTIITDPPYGLSFMGKAWDHGVPGVPFWEAALRVAKPGAMLLAFGGTRTYHRLATAIEDAGWQIRDCLMWLYGTGFPKSHDISKAIDKAAGAEREVVGSRKLTGKARVKGAGGSGRGYDYGELRTELPLTAPSSDLAKQWNGWGTALKPAWEPIIVAMKPLDGTFANNATQHGVAGLNIDGSRIPTDELKSGLHKRKTSSVYNEETSGLIGEFQYDGSKGRWPANLILDEEAAQLLGEPSRFFYCAKASTSERNAGLSDLPTKQTERYGKMNGTPEHGAKHDTPEANHHPTVKPQKLMEYLCRLTATPTGGTVLDPFMGSGSTGVACKTTGRDFIGIEPDEAYHNIAINRIHNTSRQTQ